jgi:HK97 family phage prohead protease
MAEKTGSPQGTRTNDDGAVKDRVLKFMACREAEGKYKPDLENYRLWFKASTNALCDDGIMIEPTAWKKHMPTYMENPVFLDAHNYSSVFKSLGHAVDWEIVEDGLMVQYEFAVGRNPWAIFAWDMYMAKDLSAVSVGWKTLKYERVEPEEEKKGFLRVLEARLLETSAVPVPMDSGALVERMMEFSLSDPQGVLVRAMREFVYLEEASMRPGWEDTNEDDAKKGQIRYQIKPPEAFNEKTFVILTFDVKGKKDVQIVRGKYPGKKDDGKLHAQSIHFNKKDGWGMAGAKKWWNDHKEELAKGLKIEGTDVRFPIEGLDEVLGIERELGLDWTEKTAGAAPEEQEDRLGKVISAKNMKIVDAAINACRVTVRALNALKSAGSTSEGEKGDEDGEWGEVDEQLRDLVALTEGLSDRELDEGIRELIPRED